MDAVIAVRVEAAVVEAADVTVIGKVVVAAVENGREEMRLLVANLRRAK